MNFISIITIDGAQPGMDEKVPRGWVQKGYESRDRCKRGTKKNRAEQKRKKGK